VQATPLQKIPLCTRHPHKPQPHKKQLHMKTLLALTTAALFFMGCASTPDNLARETARTIGGLTSDQVTISNVVRGATSVRWVATTPSGIYDCEADDMVRRVNAVKRAKETLIKGKAAMGLDCGV
jgi:hypothetical protein